METVIVLKSYFQNINKHPGPDERSELSKKTGETEKQIRQWFNNERFKTKLI